MLYLAVGNAVANSINPRNIRRINLVPRVLSLPRESTLVAAGHVSMYANQIRIGVDH